MNGAILGEAVRHREVLAGGDLSAVTRVTLASGRTVIEKRAPGVGREARMLAAIEEAGVPCPRVLAAADGVMVMTDLGAEAAPTQAALHEAGAAVGRLHRSTSDDYGWDEDHAFGEVAIPNAPDVRWPVFWAKRRLLAWPDLLPVDLTGRLERLASRMPDVLPERPPPALLHGDLWSGNLIFGERAFSGLIDPACYHGHSEVDLAMLDLFGGLHPAFLEAYGALEDGWPER